MKLLLFVNQCIQLWLQMIPFIILFLLHNEVDFLQLIIFILRGPQLQLELFAAITLFRHLYLPFLNNYLSLQLPIKFTHLDKLGHQPLRPFLLIREYFHKLINLRLYSNISIWHTFTALYDLFLQAFVFSLQTRDLVLKLSQSWFPFTSIANLTKK